ncbi:phosphatidylserine/phosphatidylglycerophosphate/cardiolipin synthase family protein [Novosphingobium sp. TH158]|uniref:phospholipase D-like domain-containing protein n=1 Tax=Novosphingobium sp. TH158 TaxID=2067455 RepID=UPI00130434B9|nr:phosphatidylserine/phosphatidylglycerophosphate/cardiolipin synthase family protein [Novosphingobium sp. TH158]
MQFSLQVGARDFWEAARADIAAARRRVLIQAMTFEGDSAGLGVAEAICASPASERRVLVDDYSRHVINDRFLALSSDPELAAEARATWDMFDAICASGAALRITNPVGGNPLNYPLRNHRKLLVMDDAVWIGGINFSEHNFAWHDMMLRIENAEVADWFAGEFDKDWRGKPSLASTEFEGLSLHGLDGANNAEGSLPLIDLFENARHSIEVISAYPTFPFVSAMARAARRGVETTIYTPRPNNKPIIRDYLTGVARRSGIALRLLPEMTHVKAVLIDGEAVVVGSSNFDFVAYRANSEYFAVLKRPEIIADFETRLFAPARSQSTEPAGDDHSPWRSLRARVSLGLADILLHGLSHPVRIGEWRRP